MSRARLRLAVVFAVVGVVTVMTTGAQQVVHGETGEYFGNVHTGSARFDGYRGQEYSIAVSGGVQYQIDVTSDDFDAYVVVYHPDGSRHYDDDGGDGVNARLFTTPSTGGRMRVIARSFNRDATGNFILTITQGSTATLSSRTISLGTYTGNLGNSSGSLDGYRADEYFVPVSAGTSYQVDVMSDEFDAYLIVVHPDGTQEQNDDGGAGLDSRLVTTPRTSGDMRVIARSFNRDPVGEYTVRVEQADVSQAVESAPRRVELGAYTGTLDRSSPRFDGYRGQEYIVSVEQWASYQIDVMSDDFDAYLVVYQPDGRRLTDDDGGDWLNARLTVRPNTSGDLRIIARSYGQDPLGEYVVEVRNVDDR